LRDPGTITFSHKAHLELAKKWAAVAADEGGGEGSHWRAVVKEQSQALEKQDCQYCHKLDAARRYVAPVLYEDHCAACHPLLPQLTGDWPPPLARPFRQTPLHHPGPKETAANVRGELLERFSMLVLRGPAPAVSFPDEEVRPFPLQRPLPPLDEKQRQILGQRFHAERSLFDPKGGEPLPGFKDLNFDVKGGCAFCHKEEGRYEDGTPRYEPPRLGERWKDLKFPVERFDAEAYRFDRNHWFPHANFDHDAHRMTTCAECHAARDSEKSADVLMPGIDTCKKCHNGTSAGARSDCLECHGYHDHSQDQGTNRNPPALDAILGTAGR
jgi:hypothetical protein